MNVSTKSIVVDPRELEALRRNRIPAAGSSGSMNADTTPIVVDLGELEALQRSRIPGAELADQYLGRLTPTPAETAPSFDFWAGAALVPGPRARLH